MQFSTHDQARIDNAECLIVFVPVLAADDTFRLDVDFHATEDLDLATIGNRLRRIADELERNRPTIDSLSAGDETEWTVPINEQKS